MVSRILSLCLRERTFKNSEKGKKKERIMRSKLKTPASILPSKFIGRIQFVLAHWVLVSSVAIYLLDNIIQVTKFEIHYFDFSGCYSFLGYRGRCTTCCLLFIYTRYLHSARL